ncbi:MAG: 2-hydroxyacyl-CoA dehydratase family protein [Clostridioides sp.]|nr:2-hydroxyacyl-CoA dehydratase family protein [Clostridioides sp.]
METNLPKQFDSFAEGRKQGFLAAKQLKDDGKKMVGVFCCFTPVEIAMAAGAVPVSICGVSEEPIPDAEKILPRNLCPLVKSSFGHAITDTCPYFYFSDLLIGETTCDGKKKMYEELAKIKNMHVMHLPNMASGEYSMKLWRDEIVKLKEVCERELETTITEEDIKNAIIDKNEERRLLQDFYSLAKHKPAPMTGMELHNVLYQSGFKFERNELKESLKEVIAEAKERIDKDECKAKKDAPRILITGSPIGGVAPKILQTLEDAGASVVALELCNGIRSNDKLVDEDKDVYDALAQRYLGIGCSCMMDNDNRIELIGRLMDEYDVDGVIDVVLTACHTFNIESYRIKEFVTKEKGKSYMAIETDYSQSDKEQLKTRFEAFVEMLETNTVNA